MLFDLTEGRGGWGAAGVGGATRRGWGAPSARRPRGSPALWSRLGHTEPDRPSAARDCAVVQACSARYGVAGSTCPNWLAKAQPAPQPPPRHRLGISKPPKLHPPQLPPHRKTQTPPTAPLVRAGLVTRGDDGGSCAPPCIVVWLGTQVINQGGGCVQRWSTDFPADCRDD